MLDHRPIRCVKSPPSVCVPIAHMEQAHFTTPQAIVCKWCDLLQ